jgi:hypothetical protein
LICVGRHVYFPNGEQPYPCGGVIDSTS